MNTVLLFALVAAAQAKLITIRNDVPRLDTDGNIIDAHSGMILPVNGVFYLYGERYTNSTGFGPSPPQLFPKLVVYTSSDMQSWTYGGEVLTDWPTKPFGTFFTPWAVYDKATNTFVLWFNAYLNGCCSGNWGVATSKDGLRFTLATTNMTGKYSVVDCNALFVDDDGAAYMLYTSETENHRVSIEVLTSNYSSIVPGANKGLFPDGYVEGAILFKRGSTYYMSEGSCCCFCRGGAGVVVYKSESLNGPWVRQPLDLNCNRTDAGDICGAFGERDHDPIRIQAQGIGLSLIPLADGSTAYLWHGERWISAPFNNPACDSECATCTEDARYVKGHSYSYWIPLAFDNATGDVLPFAEFVDSFTLDIAEGFETAHLAGLSARGTAALLGGALASREA
jgi:hypothetical protein